MEKIQFITHQTEQISYIESAKIALQGGCRWIQLRMKEADEETFIRTALAILPECRKHQAIFILDDRVSLVKELKADGVHLGKMDMPVQQARQILGPNAIIGATANTFFDVFNHYQNGANYVGCGPYRYTSTKKNLSPILGLEGYTSILAEMKQVQIAIPIVAIGGILADDIAPLMATGLSGIAVSGAILNAEHPVDEMKHMIQLLNSI